MTKVAVAMLGARRHYAVPRLLHEAGVLHRFFTDSYIGNKPWMEAVIGGIPPAIRPAALARWLGRNSDALPPEKVISFEKLGLWYVWSLKRARSAAETQAVFVAMASRFNQLVVEHGIGESDIVWGFNGASLGLFKDAKSIGRRCVLEQTSNPKPIERALAAEEHKRWRDWISDQQKASSEPERDEGEAEEWKLADRIVAGSKFVADGLISEGVDQSKVSVLPYGVDLDRFAWVGRPSFSQQRPLRVLFVGRVSIMKGVPYLLDALKGLGPKSVQAHFVGNVAIDSLQLDAFRCVAKFLGPIARSSMLEHYQWADVFCFPSITEGSAAVTYEALATGLPVITTRNAGSIVRDEVDGFVVPIRSSNKLAEALHRYVEDPTILTAHQEQLRDGRERAGLERYKNDLVHVIRGFKY